MNRNKCSSFNRDMEAWHRFAKNGNDSISVAKNWANYMSEERNMLAAVKQELYHPDLPTFRRMEMDDSACKLCDEHCRTSTFLDRSHFKKPELRWKPHIPYRNPSDQKPKDFIINPYTADHQNWNEDVMPISRDDRWYLKKGNDGVAIVRSRNKDEKEIAAEWGTSDCLSESKPKKSMVKRPYRTAYNLFQSHRPPTWLGS